jgi:hypothetical protein
MPFRQSFRADMLQNICEQFVFEDANHLRLRNQLDSDRPSSRTWSPISLANSPATAKSPDTKSELLLAGASPEP